MNDIIHILSGHKGKKEIFAEKYDDLEPQTVVLLLLSHQASCDLVIGLICYKYCHLLVSKGLTLTACLNVSYLLARLVEKIQLFEKSKRLSPKVVLLNTNVLQSTIVIT
jgi:hypothetical protein